MRRFILTLTLCCLCLAAAAQAIKKDFKPICDSLSAKIQERTGVYGVLRLQNVMKRGNTLDFYFTESLGDYPWRESEPEWFRKELRRNFPDKYKNYSLGRIYSKGKVFDDLSTTQLDFDGRAVPFKHSIKEPSADFPLVKKLRSQNFTKGLEGRNIAVWQSHGRYYNVHSGEWVWQRPCLFQTVEDMFTQSFVIPYLVPMLENAGAYVLMPRERDVQNNEVIVDRDVVHQAYGISEYSETGSWEDAGPGFAALKAEYTEFENPFTSGSARKTKCVLRGASKVSTAKWMPEIPERGVYAVYISYKSLPESSEAVSYTVKHLGGESEFIVNQRIGGGTWIYLGSFEFEKGSEGYVSLSNIIPEGYEDAKGKYITTDAVRFGGGKGNIARSPLKKSQDSEEEEAVVSGLPRYAEGARYYLQWSGVDPEIYSPNEGKDDYKDDFMSRGDWVEWISRGSKMNPSKEKGLGIPLDLAFGFHSDAGVTPNDSIVGTLVIYTSTSEKKTWLPNKESRMTSREYADLVQSQIVNDIQAEFEDDWSRRQIWDRGYRESRTPSSPSMLLELLSHQNFADMKYGLNPSFRFTVSRAIYKAMLKYLSNRYGVPYAVQPLPVEYMGVKLASDASGNPKAVVSWRETADPIEPTAAAKGFILYTRIDGGGFDNGRAISASRGEDGGYSFELPIEKGHLYSYRIAAFNDGGLSFPSETVSVGAAESSSRKVLVVNNFDRISGPAYIDLPSYGGFDNRLDSGVPDVRDIAYIGETYEFRRDAEYVSNSNPGFGASYDDYAGKVVAGNTGDYAAIHGKAIMEAGYSFYSCSNEAVDRYVEDAWAIDLICGKQVTVNESDFNCTEYQVFPVELQKTLSSFTERGGNVLISGSYIATDVWDRIYPHQADSCYIEDSRKFVRKVLGYKWVRNQASRSGRVEFIDGNDEENGIDISPLASQIWSYHNEINPDFYCVESPDAISPASSKTGGAFMRYSDTRLPAGVYFNGKGYKTVSIGFPIETLKNNKDINNIISKTLEFFCK